MFFMCTFTVPSDRPMPTATSLLRPLLATMRSTSISRGVSGCRPACALMAAVKAGEMKSSPACAARIARIMSARIIVFSR